MNQKAKVAARNAKVPGEWLGRFARARVMAKARGMQIKTIPTKILEQPGNFRLLSADTILRIIKGTRRSRHYDSVLHAFSKVIAAVEGRGDDKNRVQEILRYCFDGTSPTGDHPNTRPEAANFTGDYYKADFWSPATNPNPV